MTTIVVEIYDALRQAGVDEDGARAAARAVLSAEEKEQLATKADVEGLRLAVKADILVVKADVARIDGKLTILIALNIAMLVAAIGPYVAKLFLAH